MRSPFNYRFGLPSPFYDNETSFVPEPAWLLTTGFWDDYSQWLDDAIWNDSAAIWALTSGFWNDSYQWVDTAVWID